MTTASGFTEALGAAYCTFHSGNGRTVPYVAAEWDLRRAIDVVKAHILTYGGCDGTTTAGGYSIRSAVALMDSNELAVAKTRWPFHANALQAAYTEAHS